MEKMNFRKWFEKVEDETIRKELIDNFDRFYIIDHPEGEGRTSSTLHAAIFGGIRWQEDMNKFAKYCRMAMDGVIKVK
jgi:trehalose/maltose hydrolase-like predicted phosphorylase